MTAIFDIGRTNKKFFLFDRKFREVYREYATFPMIADEDGFPCEDIQALTRWLREVFDRVLASGEYPVEAVNFSAYGATLVHVDHDGRVLTPVYNYEKPLPGGLEDAFYGQYDGDKSGELDRRTGSDRAGMLNSGKQLYWLRHRRPEVFGRIRHSLHLPQFLSYVFTGIPLSEYTSIGCHTGLWDYEREDYHEWVYAEGVHRVLPPIVPTETSINMNYNGRRLRVGVGIHDSSAALLPYLRGERKPFLLVSTGTWSVSLNPFAEGHLTAVDRAGNCINYLRIDGKPVRAARLFLGEEYKHQTELLARYFNVPTDTHRTVRFTVADYQRARSLPDNCFPLRYLGSSVSVPPRAPALRLPPDTDYGVAYHRLLLELTDHQAASIEAARGGTKLRKLFVDGGFSDNEVYVKLLAHRFADLKLRTTDASLGSALGAAVCISDQRLNSKFLKENYGLRKRQPFLLHPDEVAGPAAPAPQATHP